ncbi:MFS transporter [Micromonospora sp. NPDC051925]|uniref:MFS transporter n=1 Tax=Micromonospora sp. NPDC051925 TaxID=3364288 RepID=UPI0037C9FACA
MADGSVLTAPDERLGGPWHPLVGSYFVTYLGDGLFYVCAALYFTRIVGLDPVTYGAALTASWLVALLLGVPVGQLADRYEARAVSIAMLTVSGLVVGVFLITPNLPVFVVAACVFSICTQGTHSARSALIARVFPVERVTRVRALLIATANAGLAVGALLGGLVIAADSASAYRTAFAADALMFLVAAALLLLVPRALRTPVASDVDESPATRQRIRNVFADRGYVAVGLANMLLCLHIPLIDVAIPLWVVQRTAAPEWIIAGVFVVNTLLVVLLQYRMARRIRSIDHGVRTLRWAGVLLFGGMALYAASAVPSHGWVSAALLLAGSAVLTFGEMRQTASMTEISFRLVPDGRYGQYQGFFGMGSTAAEAAGPLVVTWLVISQGAWGWLALGVVFLVASFAVRFGVDLARRSPLLRENAA